MNYSFFRRVYKIFFSKSVLKKNISKCDGVIKSSFNHFKVNSNENRINLLCKQNFLLFGLGLVCLFLSVGLKNVNKIINVSSVDALDLPNTPSKVSLRRDHNFIADVVDKVASSVVYIAIIDSKRRDFFTGQPIVRSNGSGFIVHSDGLILTNAHVVNQQRNTELMVKLNDGTTYKAFVENVDVRRDLATIRIKPSKRLPVMRLGSSNDLRPGEWVVALGSPLSLSNTATCGVVSSIERTAVELGIRDGTMYYIQTDASITFGNSGGPLVNLDGEAIGINSMKVTTGISFAIPIEYAKDFLNRSSPSRTSAVSHETKKYTGMTILSLNSDIIRELQMRDSSIPNDVTFGVLIWKVIKGSPADEGGLQPGDILTYVNSIPIRDADTLYNILEDASPHSISIVVVRGDKNVQLTVTPQEIML